VSWAYGKSFKAKIDKAIHVVRRWKTSGLAVLSIASVASLAIAQGFDPWQDSPLMKSVTNCWAPNSQQPTLGQLANNEAIVIDLKNFNIAKVGAKAIRPHTSTNSKPEK